MPVHVRRLVLCVIDQSFSWKKLEELKFFAKNWTIVTYSASVRGGSGGSSAPLDFENGIIAPLNFEGNFQYEKMCTKIWRLYVFTFYILCREKIFSRRCWVSFSKSHKLMAEHFKIKKFQFSKSKINFLHLKWAF